MRVDIDPAAYHQWLAARAEYDAAMRDGPVSVTPRNQMSTRQLVAVKAMATAAMRALMSIEVEDGS